MANGLFKAFGQLFGPGNGKRQPAKVDRRGGRRKPGAERRGAYAEAAGTGHPARSRRGGRAALLSGRHQVHEPAVQMHAPENAGENLDVPAYENRDYRGYGYDRERGDYDGRRRGYPHRRPYRRGEHGNYPRRGFRRTSSSSSSSDSGSSRHVWPHPRHHPRHLDRPHGHRRHGYHRDGHRNLHHRPHDGEYYTPRRHPPYHGGHRHHGDYDDAEDNDLHYGHYEHYERRGFVRGRRETHLEFERDGGLTKDV